MNKSIEGDLSYPKLRVRSLFLSLSRLLFCLKSFGGFSVLFIVIVS